jgi:hypothetical protein
MFPILPGSNPSGYNLTRSLRFRASASAYLNRAFSSGNQVLWTWSSWVKRGTLGTYQVLFGVQVDGNTVGTIGFDSDKLAVINKVGGSTGGAATTNAVFRDPSAWYHIVVAYNGNGAAATDKFKLYVNSVLQTFSATENYSTGNGYINSNVSHGIGRRDTLNDAYFDGYLAEVNFIDGQALTPASFGSTNALTGVWQPAAYVGTYGTNGFYLPFTDNSTAAALGTDFSGNSNTWTTNNISVTAGVTYDSMTDVPTLTNATTANYPVLNRLQSFVATLTNGNLTWSQPATAYRYGVATIAIPATGKYIFEALFTTTPTTDNYNTIGVINDAGFSKLNASMVGTTTGFYGINDASSSFGQSFVQNGARQGSITVPNGTVIQVLVDRDNNQLTFTKDGTLQTGTGSTVTIPSGDLYMIVGDFGSTGSANFGQRPFAYTPPTGFVALNAFNLPAATIVKGNTVMDATLYTGNGSTQTITNAAGFQSDFIWIKNRSGANSNQLTDSVRGITKYLFSDVTLAEETRTNQVTAITSTGFSLDSGGAVNTSGNLFVGWQWQAGQGTTSSNTAGSITSTVSVNASAGFSVVTYTGNATTGATVGHGLGVAPAFVIAKARGAVTSWPVYHQSLGASQYILLNGAAAAVSSTQEWGGVAPTSTVITIGNASANNNQATTNVLYAWAEIAGFSKFGSYAGNASTDGPFVYTGFRPKWVMVKTSSVVGNWFILDAARNTYNAANTRLVADLAVADDTNAAYSIDFLSNGFKLRSSSNVNVSGTYIYMAFSENPFKNALAR